MSYNNSKNSGALILSMCSATQVASIAAWCSVHGTRAGIKAAEYLEEPDGVKMPAMLAFLDGRGDMNLDQMKAISMAFYMDILTMLKLPRDQDYYRDQLKAL